MADSQRLTKVASRSTSPNLEGPLSAPKALSGSEASIAEVTPVSEARGRARRLSGAGAVMLFAFGGTACAHDQAVEIAPNSSRHAPVHSALATPGAVAQPSLALASPQVNIADVVEHVMPTVVNISLSKVAPAGGHRGSRNDPFFRFFGPGFRAPEQHASGMGSGVIVSGDGLILTNNHVVENARAIKVTLYDEREFDAEVVGSDPKTDMALLRLTKSPGSLQAIEFGDSHGVRLGEVVLAVGNPFGVGQTVTQGIVSAKGRANVGIVDYEDFIQTDAAINPGNSGGALVNMRGELVGINTAILSRSGGADGIGFAIPSNMAKGIMQSLLDHGSVQRGRLGVVIQDLNSDLAQAMGLKDTRGVLIGDVQPGSAAAKAGLKRGDVVLTVDGKSVPTTGKLRNAIALAGAGRDVALGLLRNGDAIQLVAKLGGEDEQEASAKPAAEPAASLALGLKVQPLTHDARQRFGVGSHILGGVIVRDVERGSSAARAGLRPGDVILEANRKSVKSPKDLSRQLEARKDRVLLLVFRSGQTLFVVLKD